MGGIYLGFIDDSGKEKLGLKYLQWVFGTGAVLFGILFANTLTEKGMNWDTYSDSEVSEAKENNVPVILDFYADWCIPCLELDRVNS